MVSNIPPFRPHTPKESGLGRISGQPRTPSSNRPSQFRRTMKDDHRTKQRNKDKAVDETDEEESASVFELARQTKKKQIEESSIEDAEQKQEAFRADGEQIQENVEVDEEQLQDASMASEEQLQDISVAGEDQIQAASMATEDQIQEDFSSDEKQVQEETASGEVNEWTRPAEDEMPAEGEMSLEDFYANMDTLVSKEFSPPPLPHELKESQTNPLLNASKIQQATVAASTKQPSTAKARTDKPVEGTSIKQKVSSSSKSPIKKTDEGKTDMTGVAPIAPQPTGFQSDKLQETQKAAPSATIREIATQIVDRIQIMRKDNETLTTITLRHPPILEGATITLATSDNAKREFNITFANLSPDAKLLLDRKLKEDSLTATLERKGIIVHTLTTTTQPQNLVSAEAGQTPRDRQDQQQQQQQQKRQQPQTPEDEELA